MNVGQLKALLATVGDEAILVTKDKNSHYTEVSVNPTLSTVYDGNKMYAYEGENDYSETIRVVVFV